MRRVLLFVAPMLLAPTCEDGSDVGKITGEGDSGLGEPTGGPGGDADGDGTLDEDDCAPEDPAIHPEADEVCDGVDNNCDGVADDAWSVDASTWYADRDGDGYGDPEVANVSCLELSGWVADDRDCDDSRADIYPGADEPEDGVDHNCDGDRTLDGVTTFSGVQVVATGEDLQHDIFQVPVEGEVALRVFSVQEASGGSEVQLSYRVDEPVILVLVSSRTTDWTVSEAFAGSVREIHTADEASVSTAPEGVAVTLIDNLLYDEVWDAVRVRSLESKLADLTGLSIHSFNGANSVSSFTVVPGEFTLDPAYPQCDDYVPSTVGTGPEFSVVDPACSPIMEESTWCLAMGGGHQLHLVGLDSGDECTLEVDSPSEGSYSTLTSMAWLGEHVYFCDFEHYGMLERVSLADGSLEKSYVYCDGLVDDHGELMVFASSGNSDMSQGRSYTFAGFEDLQCGTWSGEIDGWPVHAERFTSHDDTVYGAWHSTNSVHMWDVESMSSSGELFLEDFSGWVNGMSVIDAGVLAISTSDAGIMTFDASSGEPLDTVMTDVATYALECFSGI